jgi:hypothetical protein
MQAHIPGASYAVRGPPLLSWLPEFVSGCMLGCCLLSCDLQRKLMHPRYGILCAQLYRCRQQVLWLHAGACLLCYPCMNGVGGRSGAWKCRGGAILVVSCCCCSLACVVPVICTTVSMHSLHFLMPIAAKFHTLSVAVARWCGRFMQCRMLTKCSKGTSGSCDRSYKLKRRRLPWW